MMTILTRKEVCYEKVFGTSISVASLGGAICADSHHRDFQFHGGKGAGFVERIFDKVVPDPSVQLVAQGTAQLLEFQPDALVALGGGSAIDCAK
ncbi:MAG: iron-containing alcohol dehydrogenase, partial [Bacteroidaceae bacterium]|nr:iron-containing alcohol dehydrogenase [Bacteroidaceae bacterium]